MAGSVLLPPPVASHRAQHGTQVNPINNFMNYSDVTMEVARQKKFSPIAPGSLSSSYDVSPPTLLQGSSFEPSPTLLYQHFPPVHAQHMHTGNGVDLFKTENSPPGKIEPRGPAANTIAIGATEHQQSEATEKIINNSGNKAGQKATDKKRDVRAKHASGAAHEDDFPLIADQSVGGAGVFVKSTVVANVTDDFPLVSEQDGQEVYLQKEARRAVRSANIALAGPVDDDFPLIAEQGGGDAGEDACAEEVCTYTR